MASFINLPKYLQGPYKSLDMRWLRTQDCLREAEELGIKKVFVLTYAQGFFSKFNFEEVKKVKDEYIFLSTQLYKPYPVVGYIRIKEDIGLFPKAFIDTA